MKMMHRMLAAPAISIALALVIAGLAAWSMQQQRAALNELAGRASEARRVANGARLEVASVQAHVYRLFALAGGFDKRVSSEHDAIKRRLASVVVSLQATELAADHGELAKAAETAIVAAARKADDALDRASIDATVGLVTMMSAEEQFKSTLAALEALDNAVAARAGERIVAGNAMAGRAVWIIGIALLVGAAGAIGFSVVLARATVGSVRRAVDATDALADGNLGATIDTTGRDEVGDLARSLEKMRTSMARIIGDIRGASESILHSSTEVAQGNQDLSSRTEQQASSLQQTAASMEQMTGTVRQNADAAKQANQLASAASEVAAKGGQVVADVVTRMSEISASSKKIAEIIGVIDGIAFQTNILALNAAVEAARAGEQGRGFAVVAGEVRNLAQRSAQAAREIKGLIADSVAKVESGSQLVNEAGQTMDDIVMQVKRVTDLIGEITSATLEQSAGIGQVNQSVNQLDEMTQQNATLVEQSAAAASSLKDQADRLAEAVAIFKLSTAEAKQAIAQAKASSRQTVVRNDTSGTASPAPKAKSAAPFSPAPVAFKPQVPRPAKADDDWEEF